MMENLEVFLFVSCMTLGIDHNLCAATGSGCQYRYHITWNLEKIANCYSRYQKQKLRLGKIISLKYYLWLRFDIQGFQYFYWQRSREASKQSHSHRHSAKLPPLIRFLCFHKVPSCQLLLRPSLSFLIPFTLFSGSLYTFILACSVTYMLWLYKHRSS